MTRLLGVFPDLTIAVVLLVVAGVVLLVARMGVLPKKSLPFIIAGLLGVFGYALFRKRREQALREDLKRHEQELADLARRASQHQAGVAAAEQQLAGAREALQRQQEATQKEMLRIHATNAQERERLSTLHGAELFQEFDKEFGSPVQP
jgi:Skp family chaperone for outer membrane proteins